MKPYELADRQDEVDPAEELRDRISFMSAEEAAFVNLLAGDVLTGGIAFAKRIAAIQLLATHQLPPSSVASIMPLLDPEGSERAGLLVRPDFEARGGP